MLTAEAQVETERPGRYLVQLCRHASQMGQHLRQRQRTHDGGDAPPEVQHVEWSDTYGIVRLNWGQWTMQTTPDTLTLRVEATDEENLRRIQDLVAARLEIFGRRDHLKVNWQRFEAPTAQRGEGEHGRGSTRRRPRWVMVFGIILVKLGVIALILVLPFGLAISLGVGHGVALLVMLVAVAVTLLAYKLRGKTLHSALSHGPHRFLSGLRPKLARIFKNRGSK
jgi:hypothetical protein